MFSAASLTDLIDGYIARKFKQETELGKFLDPLADKILVVATLVVFILLEEQIQLWMVLVIIFRDMLVTSMRFLAIRKGTPLMTSKFGKAKTAFQMMSLLIILLIFAVRTNRVNEEVNEFYRKHNLEYLDQSEKRSHIQIASERFVWAWNSEKHDLVSFIAVYSYSVPYFLMFLTTVITFLSGLRYLITNWRLFKPPILIKNS
jgi:cardiolipin synthase